MDKRIASIRNLTFLIICGLSLLTSCSKDEDVNWSGSHLRQWLNSDFLHRAFSETERNAIETTSVENAPNVSYGTNCGPDSGIDDAARRFRSTLYAKCRGAWWSSVTGYRGNSHGSHLR